MSSFSQKRIDVRLTLENKVFPNQQDANVMELKGFRVLANIKKTGVLDQGSKTKIVIYGLKQEDMNVLSILVWEAGSVQNNKIEISAGDEQGMSQVFSGDITEAVIDYSSSPEVSLVIEAIPVYIHRIAAAEATSYPNGVDVATAMQNLASKMGYTFVNNGVDIKLTSTYFPATLMQQAEEIAKQANIVLYVDNQTLFISPKGVPISGTVPLISPQTGLIGYPTYRKNGVAFGTLFNPAIRFNGLLQLESSLDFAQGEWLVTGLEYQLESEKTGGSWFCQVEAERVGHVVTEE